MTHRLVLAAIVLGAALSACGDKDAAKPDPAASAAPAAATSAKPAATSTAAPAASAKKDDSGW